VYEIFTLSARDLKNPLLENLEVVVSGWGAYDLGEVRWNAGTTDNLSGDLTAGYVRGQLFKRALTLRAGRAYVAAGTGRMLQLEAPTSCCASRAACRSPPSAASRSRSASAPGPA